MHFEVDELEARLNRFNRLLAELISGDLSRNAYQSWEVELLLDIEACQLLRSNRREVLRRYQKAANRFVERGGRRLLKLSEYLAGAHRNPPPAAG